MEVTTTLISSLLAVNIVDIAVRELRIRRDAKETIKAIEKISLSNEDCRIKVDYLHKEFGDLTSLMLSNKLHYDQISDEMTSRIDLMQVRHNKENLLLQSEIKEMSKDLSVQISTLKNELQATIKTIEELKKKSQFRVVPASELFAQENFEIKVHETSERFDSLTKKDEKSSRKSDVGFDRTPAEDLLNDATPIMDWANDKLHEDEPKKVEEPSEEPSEIENESDLTEKERRQVALKEALDIIMDKYKISLPKAKVVLKWILEKAKAKDEQKTESEVDEQSIEEQQSKRRGRPRKETKQIVEDSQPTETPSKSKKKQPLFTTREVHDEILRKLKIKWFTLRRKYGEEYYIRQYKKAYKRLYYYKFDAVNNSKQTSLTQTQENNTNYESIF